ncbi:MAG: hypothetical protein V1750_07300, partial [Acidobacteriota bacterium]
AGFKGHDATTTPAREALAGLRIGAINAHQKVLGSEYVLAPDAREDDVRAAFNLMVKHLAGATPVWAWDAPLIGADYSGLVYKLFTRGSEDIIVAWSNAEGTLSLELAPAGEEVQIKEVNATTFGERRGALTISVRRLASVPAAIHVRPLAQLVFLVVVSDRPGFGWLDELQVGGAGSRPRRRLPRG